MSVLDELARLLEAATDGPWILDGPVSREDGHMVYTRSGNGHLVADLIDRYSPETQGANADLICFARNHGPALLAFARDCWSTMFYLVDGDCTHDCTEQYPCGPCAARAVLDKHRAVIGGGK